MRRKSLRFAVVVLALASIACATPFGGSGNDSNPPSATSQDALPSGGNADASASGFPVTADAYNVIDVGDGSVLFYTNLSQDDVLKFYRNEYVSRGYTERALLTVIEDDVFSIVFDGDPSGQAVVIQSVDLGDGSRTVSISYQDV